MLLFFIISFVNVLLHISRSILVIKASKLVASLANMITYTFSAVVVKSIADNDLITSIIVLSTTNFLGCWVGMYITNKLIKNREYENKNTN